MIQIIETISCFIRRRKQHHVERKYYYMYLAIVFGVSILLAVLIFTLDHLIPRTIELPTCEFGPKYCWFHEGFERMVFFYVPMGIVMLLGCCMYAISIEIVFFHGEIAAEHQNLFKELKMRYANS
jgi:hypothetical protein